MLRDEGEGAAVSEIIDCLETWPAVSDMPSTVSENKLHQTSRQPGTIRSDVIWFVFPNAQIRVAFINVCCSMRLQIPRVP